MVSMKKIAAVAASAAVAAVMAVSLAGCGEEVAATWAHGKILEEDITKAATDEMAGYVTEDGSTDVEAWTKYIEDREYNAESTEDEDSSDSDTTDADSKDKDSKDEDKAEETQEKGTVAEYREYLIDKALRSEIVKYQIKEQKIEVTEEEIDTEVQNEAVMYEAYYGGGMSGTFESIINNYFGMSMEDFRSNVSDYLAEQKLQAATVGTADSAEDTEATEDEDSGEAEDSEAADDSEKADDEEDVDYDKLFEEYVDNQVENADLKVTDCPADLSYDPTVVAKNAESASSEDSESSEDAEDSESSDDSEETDSDEASKDEDASATKEGE